MPSVAICGDMNTGACRKRIPCARTRSNRFAVVSGSVVE